MNNNSSSGGSDYSFLLGSIQSRLNEYGGIGTPLAPTVAATKAVLATAGTGVKSSGFDFQLQTPLSTSFRRRALDDEHDDHMSTSKKLRVALEVDTLRIQNEQLAEHLESIKSEHERTLEKMQRQLTFLNEENSELRLATQRATDKYYEEKKNGQSRIRTLEAELTSIKKQLTKPTTATTATANSSSSSSSSTLQQQHDAFVSEFEAKLLKKVEEVKRLTILTAEYEQRLTQQQQEIAALKTEIPKSSKLSSNDQSSSTAPSSTATTTAAMLSLEKRVEDLESQLRRRTRELEKASTRLVNQSALEEELLSAKSRVQLLQGRVTELVAAEGRLAALSSERAEWSSALRDILRNNNNNNGSGSGSGDGVSVDGVVAGEEVGPAAAVRLLSGLQRRCSLLLLREGELETQLRDTRRSLATQQQQQRSQQQSLEEQQLACEAAEQRANSNERQLRLLQGELKTLRSLMQVQQQNNNNNNSNNNKEGAGGVLLRVDDGGSTAAALREELDKCRDSFAQQQQELLQQQQVVRDLRAQLVQLQQQQQQQQQQQGKAVELDYDPAETRVLHFSRNPFTLQQQQQQQQQQGTSTSNTNNTSNNESVLNTTITTSTAGATTTGATTATADSAKLNQRLKEMFKERIAAFREAVYLLTGFKVDLLAAENNNNNNSSSGSPSGGGGGVSRLRLRSMYAEHPDDSLLFQLRGDSLELLDTPFAGKLEPRLFTYLSTSHSVPCFLSNVTLQLFENQTFLG